MKRVTHELPDWLEPVLAFINTVDVEDGTDLLAAGPAALANWLGGRGLLPVGTEAARAEHQLALDLRAGLRCLTLMNNDGPADEAALAGLRRALDRLPLIAAIASPAGSPALRPHKLPPVRAALAGVVAGYALAVGTGHWSRIRRCPADDCAWVFWDSSAKGTRRWCTMSVCGNRAKARAFAERRTRDLATDQET